MTIYIAEAGSTDSILNIIGKFISERRLNIKIVPGGYPPEGRNNEASYCKNEFILFLDADIELGENSSIEKSLSLALEGNLDLVATYIKYCI